jgi:hypothetical protein
MQRVVLDMLVQSYPAPWTVAELARMVVGRPLQLGNPEPSTGSIHDALSHLYASHAAVEGHRLYDDDPEPYRP